MAVGPLAADVLVAFFLASCLLYRYGNCYRHHIIVTIAVLVAWYFSFLIIFVLPLDVSAVSILIINLNWLILTFKTLYALFLFLDRVPTV